MTRMCLREVVAKKGRRRAQLTGPAGRPLRIASQQGPTRDPTALEADRGAIDGEDADGCLTQPPRRPISFSRARRRRSPSR